MARIIAAAGHVLSLATCGTWAIGAVDKAHLIFTQEIAGLSPAWPTLSLPDPERAGS